MNSRSNKKSRSSSNRGGRGKGVERQLPAAADGVYGNHRFMQAVGAMVGLPVTLVTKTKEEYEGVFTTFGPNLELVLDLPHLVNSADSPTISNPKLETIKKKIIFAMQDIVYVKAKNVDMDYATKESFVVDSVISKFNGQVQPEKELEPWHGEEAVYTDLGLGDENANGWDADDMFKKNEERYGVQTTYSPEMEGYTTPLQKKNTKEWKEQEAKAQQIALEIEHSPMTQTRNEVENGEDEEEKFSAVIRPDQGQSGGTGSGKYMPPQRRKLQDGRNNKQLPRGTLSPQSSVGAPSISNSGRYNSPSAASSNTTPYNNSNNNNNNSPQSSSISISASGPAMGSSYNSQQNQSKHHQHKHNTPQPPPLSSQSAGGPGSQQSQSSGPPATQYHSMQADTKLNGDPKDSRRIDNPHSYVREPLVHKESYHPSEHHHSNTHPHHQQQIPHHPYAQQTYQSHTQSYHSSEKPMSREPLPRDPNPPNPREQREPRKSRNQKDEQQIADFKKFGQDFKLSSEPPEKKVSLPSQQQHSQPPLPSLQQPPPPQPQHQQPLQQHNSSSMQMTKVHHSAHAMPPPPAASQPPPQIPQPHTQHQVTSIPPQHHKMAQPDAQQIHSNSSSNIPPTTQQQQQQQQQQRQQSPPQQLQHPAQPQPQPTPQTQTQTVAQEVKPVEEENPAVLNSKLNPNAKEFILNPNAKPFNPRSPSTTTPPRVQTPQIVPTQSQIGSVPPTVGYQQNMVHYVMAQHFPVQTQQRYPKRGPGSNQRTDYASSMQVAAATGHPILAPAPLTSLTTPQSIPTVPIPQNMMQQTPQPYSVPYQQMSMMFRMAGPPAAIPMVTTVVPTSMGMYYHGAEGHQNSQGHTPPHMYVTSGVPPHQGHQPHHVANPGPHPGQPPTPQGHSGAGGAPLPNMPTQPPTPGPTPPQAMMYGGPGAGPMGGQPTIPQHLPQHSPHTQSPHNHFSNANAALAAAAAAAASGHHPTATQLVMLPPHLASHMMPPGGAPPPHSGAGHVPSSATGYTPTSSAGLPHMNHGHPLHYIPGNAVHPIPLVHHNQ